MTPERGNAASQRQIESLVCRLRRRQLVGSRETAIETVHVIRQVVLRARFTHIDELISMIKFTGRRLVEAQPKEHTVGNTIRKILHHIREEYFAAVQNSPLKADPKSGFSISNFVLMGQPKKQPTPQKASSMERGPENTSLNDSDLFAQGLKPVLMEAIQDVLDELETVYDNVSKGAKDHIHYDEIILTIGKSKTVEAYLKSAAHYRKFTVIVAETCPSYSGHEMASILSSAGISTFLVPDASIYAIMSRVNKVILGAHAILANGGMFAIAGSLIAATAARAHSTPVVVCAGQFKLTPLWNLYHQYGALDFADPSSVLGFEEGNLVEKVEVAYPYYDYVNPELLDVYITNDGDHPPSSVYRLIKETYDDDDVDL
ncbi:hypothetical protein M0805_005954 [Coniferiporia weirii]|nr:hypothetical protein M0805_005954 [Coniferiporia weirii]